MGLIVILGAWFIAPTFVQAASLYQPDDGLAIDSSLQTWAKVDRVPLSLSLTERQTLQPDYPYHVLLTPNDPEFSLQWNFQTINTPAAWDFDQIAPLYGGDPGVVVAVLDTGLAYENYQSYVATAEIPTSRVWTNPSEIADGVDNDGNGLIDDLHGWDFVNDDAHPNDDHGHGTHVSGTILGETNNTHAVAGLAWNSTVMPLKVLDAAGNGVTSEITAAIYYAIQAGADVINLSLGGQTDDPILHKAIQAATSRGVIVVVASGNDGVGQINYPGRYPESIAVGATQVDSARAPYSNFGTNLDLVAPGGNVTLDQNSDSQPDGIAQETCTTSACSALATFYYTGTSQAAAHVSGAVALLLACGASAGSIPGTLSNSATDLGPAGYDTEYGAGLLNLQAALTQVGCSSSGPAAPGDITATSSNSTSRIVRQREPAPYIKPEFSWSGTAGAVYRLQWGKQGATATTTLQTGTSFNPTMTAQGIYQLNVAVVDALGRVSDAKIFVYRFRRPTLMLGQAGRTSSIVLTDTSGKPVRSLAARLGGVLPALTGLVEKNNTARVVLSGRGTGTSLKFMDTLGKPIVSFQPLGSTLIGGISTAAIRRLDQETVVATTGTSQGGTVRWYTSRGVRLRSVKVFSGTTSGLTITSGDLDGDGTDELLIAKNGGAELAAYDALGRRLWVVKPLGQSFHGAWSLTTVDRDHDGQAEVVVAGLSSTGNSKIVLVSKTGRSLTTWTLRPTTNGGQVDLTTADLDGDGHQEILSLTRRGRGIIDVWSAAGKRLRSLTANRATNDYSLSHLD